MATKMESDSSEKYPRNTGGSDQTVETAGARNRRGSNLEVVTDYKTELQKEISRRKRAEESLQQLNAELARRVAEQTAEINKSYQVVEAERRQFRKVLDQLPAYLVLLTPDYHVPFANKFFEQRFGKSEGRCCYDYLFGRTEPCETCETFTVLKTNSPHRWEWTGPDGRNYDIFDFPFHDTEGNALIMEVGLDVTEQKHAQESLGSASRYARSLLEASLDPLVTISAEGKITDVNEATVKVTGVTREKLIGTDFSNYFTEPEKARQGYRQVFDKGSVTDYPLTIRHKEGKLTDVLYNATVYKDTRGNVLGVFAAARDVTEKKRAEDELDRYREHLEELVEERTTELRRSEVSLARAQEIAHLGSWELDLVINKLTWSDEVYRIFGLQPKQFDATYEAFLERVHPDDRAAVDKTYSDSVQQGKDSYEIEHRIVRGDTGEIRFVHEKCEHFRDDAGNIIRSVGMVHDITERKQHEQQLKRSNENLEQFAYVASHDLQEPLRIMASYSQLLERRYKEQLDRDAKDFIEFIVDAAGRMQTLITDLLAYSRAGRHDLTLSQVDCNKVMQKVTSALSKTIEAEEARVSWDELPVVAGAEISFMQLFQNLIGNALKFRSSEPPEINVSVINKNNEWVFSVSDNGIGIEPQYKERIFQIFQRLHSRSDYAGTGIGLSICKKIVDNFGGRIWVESESGKGSTFYFTVPIERNQSDK
jgi:PAS domain S-box-containing protein